ncbi:unannotated protein [freshwater metagenome]|uniref:Unannotated protein n=1 Tax=freshwater metagenome TaxID=449393 RepID=A0A6J7GB36_9ZZZZ|nr:hypothetical protein [Actinomycetota bacterium]
MLPLPDADDSPPTDARTRTTQVLEVLRGLRDLDTDAGGTAGPEIDEAIREFKRKAGRLRERDHRNSGTVGATQRDADRPG